MLAGATKAASYYLKARREMASVAQCGGAIVPAYSYIPDPVLFVPAVALAVSSGISMSYVPSGVCGCCENCWGGVTGLLWCDGCCNCKDACSTDKGLCDCNNCTSCEDCKCGEATQLWQVVALLLAIVVGLFAIVKGILFPYVLVPNATTSPGSDLAQAFDKAGAKVRPYGSPASFVFPAVAVGFAIWSLASIQGRASPIAANVFTIVLSVAVAVLFTKAVVYRKNYVVHLPRQKRSIERFFASLAGAPEFRDCGLADDNGDEPEQEPEPEEEEEEEEKVQQRDVEQQQAQQPAPTKSVEVER